MDSNASPVSSSADSMQRPDSLHGDDDEDRIPDELLLKYTKADSLCHDDYPAERENSPGPSGGPRDSTTPRSGGDSARRAETPDKLPPEDPEETT